MLWKESFINIILVVPHRKNQFLSLKYSSESISQFNLLKISIYMHLNSRLLIEKYAKPYFKKGVKVLEIGPDQIPSTIQNMIGETLTWHTLNIFNDERLTYPSSPEYEFPIKDDEYDIVISANVIEHVRMIWKWVPELARVIKKGGQVITVNPVSWGYHEDPVDCWRIYPEGMKALYTEAGLVVNHSVSENLESMHLYNKPYNSLKMWPGSSMNSRQYTEIIKMAIGYPVTASIDTITIGTK